MRHPRHAPPGRREQRDVAVVAGHARHRLGMLGDADAEGLGDAVGGDVVVRRADAAGGEDVVELLAHLVHGGDDRRLDVGDDPAFRDPDAEQAELGGEVLDVGVLGAAAQDLVADDEDAGGDGLCRLGHCHAHFPFLSGH